MNCQANKCGCVIKRETTHTSLDNNNILLLLWCCEIQCDTYDGSEYCWGGWNEYCLALADEMCGCKPYDTCNDCVDEAMCRTEEQYRNPYQWCDCPPDYLGDGVRYELGGTGCHLPCEECVAEAECDVRYGYWVLCDCPAGYVGDGRNPDIHGHGTGCISCEEKCHEDALCEEDTNYYGLEITRCVCPPEKYGDGVKVEQGGTGCHDDPCAVCVPEAQCQVDDYYGRIYVFCDCPEGYAGDGRLDGEGCKPIVDVNDVGCRLFKSERAEDLCIGPGFQLVDCDATNTAQVWCFDKFSEQIRPYGDSSLCWEADSLADGEGVSLQLCSDDPVIDVQKWINLEEREPWEPGSGISEPIRPWTDRSLCLAPDSGSFYPSSGDTLVLSYSTGYYGCSEYTQEVAELPLQSQAEALALEDTVDAAKAEAASLQGGKKKAKRKKRPKLKKRKGKRKVGPKRKGGRRKRTGKNAMK